MSEDELEDAFERELVREGILGAIPEPLTDFSAYYDYKPITVTGQPLSEMIIEERSPPMENIRGKYRDVLTSSEGFEELKRQFQENVNLFCKLIEENQAKGIPPTASDQEFVEEILRAIELLKQTAARK